MLTVKEIDLEIIWVTATEDIQPLKNYCSKIISEDK